MLHTIPDHISNRMQYLEEINARDRVDGTSRWERLRQIPPETGKFISFQAALAPRGDIIEIGASGGYSSLWLSLAANEKKCKIITFEILKDKAKLARETFKQARVEDMIILIEDDALKHIEKYTNIAFCFLDAEKEIYSECYDLVIPNLLPGGILIADNVISHKEELQPMVDRVLLDKRVDALTIPVGKGLLLCRKL